MKENPFASLEKAIVLPVKTKLPLQKQIFPRLTKSKRNEPQQISDSLFNKANVLIDQLNQSFQIFEDPQHFKFTFPESLFQGVKKGQRNQIRYEQKMITEQENTFKNKLSEEQLKEIQQIGEFKVKSGLEYITLPYVWKINQALFWGKQKVKYFLNNSYASIYGIFYVAKKMVVQTIPLHIKSIAQVPRYVFTLFFGSKSIQTVVSVDYQRQIFKQFWQKIFREYYKQSDQWCSALWNYLYVYYNPQIFRPIQYGKDPEQNKKKEEEHDKIAKQYQKDKQSCQKKKETILNIHNKFNQEWVKMKKKMIIQVTNEVNATTNPKENKEENEENHLLTNGDDNLNDEKILKKLSEKKFTIYIEHLQKQLPKEEVPYEVVDSIVFILRIFSLINQKERQTSKLKSIRRKIAEDKIKQQYPIKSLFKPFFDSLINNEVEQINKQLDDDMYLTLINNKDFTSLLREDQVQACKQYIKLRVNYQILLEAKKKQIAEYHGPTRTFYSNYPLLPPYKIISDGGYPCLKKISDFITVDTSTDFWKLRLYWMRIKTWSISSLVFLFFSVWKGPLGLRCLWGTGQFNVDMTHINIQTHQVEYQTRKTVLGTFASVIQGVKKSRKTFQDAPDLGLLGKNTSRIFNYIECYVFRLLFVGIILVLIAYPILIIVASAVIFTLVLTIWLWMPLILSVTYLFNILVKQFETSFEEYGFWTRTFPLARILINVVYRVILILLAILNLILLAPIKSILVSLYTMLAYAFRVSLDKIMLWVFRNLGRTPSRDSSIAKKISGPGMSKQFYMSVNEEDVYVLTRAFLQRTLMEKLYSLTIVKIQQEKNILSKTVNTILNPFGVIYGAANTVTNNTGSLLINYREQYSIYMNRYPNYPRNVRFTQEEIDSYFENCIKIVQNYVQKYQIKGWIFDKFDLYEDMYDDLTRSVWISIFGCGQEIFEPLQKLDTRFKLEDQYKLQTGFNSRMKKSVNSVMEALQGEVELSHHQKKISPFKHNLLSRQLNNEQIYKIFILWMNNSFGSVLSETNNLRILLVPNLNIKEVIVVDEDKRRMNIKRQETIIDL